MITILFAVAASMLSCGNLPHATYDNRQFYLNSEPWSPIFESVDSASAVTIFLEEEVSANGSVDTIMFSPGIYGPYCNLDLWRYPIDTTVVKFTQEGIVEGAPGVPGIVTQIGYEFHSDSLHRERIIDSLGSVTFPVGEGMYLVILSVGGYYPRAIKDLEVRTGHRSILQFILRDPGIVLY